MPILLDRAEVKHDVWLDPGILRGEGANDERFWRIRLTFFTVWNTRFGCSLEKKWWRYVIKQMSIYYDVRPSHSELCSLFSSLGTFYLCSSTSGSSIWSSFLIVPSISAARESWKRDKQVDGYKCFFLFKLPRCLCPFAFLPTIGNKPKEWKRRGVLSGSVLFLRFFSSSWASWSISIHSAYLSCSSCS